MRLWAYHHVGNYGDELTFMEATTDHAQHLNDHEIHGRTEKEILDLGTSVAAWTWQRRANLMQRAEAWRNSVRDEVVRDARPGVGQP